MPQVFKGHGDDEIVVHRSKTPIIPDIQSSSNAAERSFIFISLRALTRTIGRYLLPTGPSCHIKLTSLPFEFAEKKHSRNSRTEARNIANYKSFSPVKYSIVEDSEILRFRSFLLFEVKLYWPVYGLRLTAASHIDFLFSSRGQPNPWRDAHGLVNSFS